MIRPAGDHSVMFAGNMSGLLNHLFLDVYGHITVPVFTDTVSTGGKNLSSSVYETTHHFKNLCLTLIPEFLLYTLRITHNYVILLDRNLITSSLQEV